LTTVLPEYHDAVFIVFRTETDQMTRTIEKPVEQVVATLEGPWTVNFQENRGAPAVLEMETLMPWNENNDNGVKYFSGLGTYIKTFNAPADLFVDGDQQWLDLGEVQNLAEVIVNGESLGIVWKPPFRINVTGALKPGENNLEIKVTNLWVNRLIGDQQPDVKDKLTYTTMPFYQADSPLLPSGLLGPVRVISRSE